ncbi:MAG: helix-turn-helix transcriptional regulator [Ruminococcaceae bacterium]|nr:helix-turn-helix transcriptional regulator [Oscillospiraceae bacterium]
MFFDIVSDLCAKNHITITQLAIELGISKSNVTNWKNGSVPKIDKVNQIAKRLGVDVNVLLGNDIKNKPTADKDSELTERQKKYIDKIGRMSDEQYRMLEIFMDGLEKSDQ